MLIVGYGYFIRACLSPFGLLKQLLQTGWLKTTDIYFLQFWVGKLFLKNHGDSVDSCREIHCSGSSSSF